MADIDSAGSNIREYSVSEISSELKRTVESTFGYVRVRGEISGFMKAASGHCYLKLKDENATIDSVIWKGKAGQLKFQPEDGLEVICSGKLTTYAPRSAYQLVIDQMEPAGEGALMALLEERRKKLTAEGLFEDDRKQDIPYLPDVIGVVTSPTGAVIRDILHRLDDRFPRHVIIWPVLVQGDAAAGQIAAAIEGFNAIEPGGTVPRPDVLIVARGGGSIEDLWAFNEEIVVRAAAASEIPLISAVGHETDTTLIDFVSDLRAPTPSAAAELAVPVKEELAYTVLDLARRQLGAFTRLTREWRTALDGLQRGLRSPRELISEQAQKFDYLSTRLPQALGQSVLKGRTELRRLDAGLRPQALLRNIAESNRKAMEAWQRLTRGAQVLLDRHFQRLLGTEQLLNSLAYTNVLARGFAVVRAAGGPTITTAAGTQAGQAIQIEFQDGQVDATIDGSGPAPRATREKSAKKKSGGDQTDLFD